MIKKIKLLRIIYRIIRNQLIGLNICKHKSGNKIVDKKYMEDLLKTLSYFKEDVLNNKVIFEIGPGNNLVSALYFISKGAKKYICIDKYNRPEITVELFEKYRRYCSEQELEIINKLFYIKDNKVYSDKVVIINDDLLKTKIEKVDIIFSNLTLEHIKNLDLLFSRFQYILNNGGLMFHSIDLSSHDKNREIHPLEFLTYSDFLYSIMTSNTDAPNRLRYSDYCKLLKINKFKIIETKIIEQYDISLIDKYKNKLNKKFRNNDIRHKRLNLIILKEGNMYGKTDQLSNM